MTLKVLKNQIKRVDFFSQLTLTDYGLDQRHRPTTDIKKGLKNVLILVIPSRKSKDQRDNEDLEI